MVGTERRVKLIEPTTTTGEEEGGQPANVAVRRLDAYGYDDSVRTLVDARTPDGVLSRSAGPDDSEKVAPILVPLTPWSETMGSDYLAAPVTGVAPASPQPSAFRRYRTYAYAVVSGLTLFGAVWLFLLPQQRPASPSRAGSSAAAAQQPVASSAARPDAPLERPEPALGASIETVDLADLQKEPQQAPGRVAREPARARTKKAPQQARATQAPAKAAKPTARPAPRRPSDFDKNGF